MALSGTLSIPGIKGSGKQPNNAGKSVVIAVSHEVTADLDETTGRPKGKDKWKHKPIVITKPIDLASPKLHAAMEAKKPIPGVTVLEFWREPPGGGKTENHYTISLNNVQIAFIRTVMTDMRRPSNTAMPEYEEVGLAYDGIGWGWHSGQKHEGTDRAESNSYVAKAAPFAMPDEAALRALVLSTIQSALSGAASEIADAAKALDQAPAAAPQPK